MKRRIQEGIFPWKPPLGYRSPSTLSEKKTEPDIPDSVAFPLLKKAWQLLLTGAYTKADICRLLTSWGLITQKGQPISAQTLDGIFANKYYAGVLADPWDGEEYPARHKPMITLQEFVEVQKILSKRSRSIRHIKHRPEFPLRGIVRCPGCQHVLTASHSRGHSRRYPYYHCRRKYSFDCNSNLPAKDAHDEFEDFLDQLSLQPKLATSLRELMLHKIRQVSGRSRTDKARVKSRLQGLAEQIARLIDMRSRDLINDEELRAQKNKLYNQRYVLEDRLRRPSVSSETVKNSLDLIEAALQDLKGIWRLTPVELRMQFGRFILPSGYVYKKVRTADLSYIFRLFRDFSDGNPRGVVPTGFEPVFPG